ncbi:uncharacterized protein [Ovis canadensis]|uniref:uncharacterized protein n=1 Tax=Ovis canadensis TaxID=37174 RepID=UPI003751228E
MLQAPLLHPCSAPEMKTPTLMEKARPPRRSWNPFTLHTPCQGSAPALPSALTGPGCPGRRCISLLAPGGGSPVSQDCLSSTPSHCELRACGALLVSPPSECPASGGKEACVGSSPARAPRLQLLPSFLPEKHLEHLRSPARPRSPVSLCGPSCRQASPRSPAQAHCGTRQPPRSLPPSAPVQRRLSSLLRGLSSVLGTGRAVSSVRGAERVLGWPPRLAPLLCHLGRPVPRPLPAQPTYHLRAEAWGRSEPCRALLTGGGGGQHGEVGHPRPCPPAFPAWSQSWAPPPALRALALSCLPAKRLKVTPVVQGTSQGLGPELSGVIFFFLLKSKT